MERGPALYRRAAELIVESEDPEGELLLVMLLEAEHQRRRRVLRCVLAAGAALVLIGAAWLV